MCILRSSIRDEVGPQLDSAIFGSELYSVTNQVDYYLGESGLINFYLLWYLLSHLKLHRDLLLFRFPLEEVGRLG